ncbi:MAG: AMP-binding protein, partial [Hyphomicrobiales bacterium]|nr:AMP-binding protein [Hyphomicrobiales bacterium]
MPPHHPGDADCLIEADGLTLSYADVAAATARSAAALAACGVKPGDRVAAQVEKSREALFLYLGCVRAGAVFLPLNTAYTPSELGYFID